MTQETFEQMATRAYETAMGQELRPRDKSSVLKVLAAFRDELGNGQEPIGWLYTDAYGTHYTDDKREWYDAVGIEEVAPVYARPFVAAPAGVMDFEPDAKRLALELECLLLDCKDMAAVSKWWDSAHEALEQHRALLSADYSAPTDAVAKDAETNVQEPVALLHRYPSKCQLKVEFEDAVTELAEGTYALYTNPFSSAPSDTLKKDAARYRWLRQKESWEPSRDELPEWYGGKVKWLGGDYSEDEIDEIIDYAMQGKESGK